MTAQGRKPPEALVVLLAEHEIGRVTRDGSRLSFTYDEAWRQRGQAIPLSLSMPLSGASYGDGVIAPWMWGLLTDHEIVLARIAKQHQVSAGNVFALLWCVGEDCSGAVQFAAPARAASMAQDGEVHWLTEPDIADRLTRLRLDYATGRMPAEGQFSLAGAQPKTALALIGGRWGVPSGRIPTTHILKPPMADLDGHAYNEVFCLRLAERAGLRAARAEVRRFGDETTIVIERYDRAPARNGSFIRIHQEDMCQAAGIHPSLKYEKDGGPGIKSIMDILAYSSDPDTDRRRFIDALALNFLIAGTDAHAKNYSVLLGVRQARLAPLYDVASYLPYYDRVGRWDDVRMPMKIDRYYRYADIMPRHWERMAKACGYPADRAVAQVTRLAAILPDAAADVATAMGGAGHQVLHRLVDRIAWRCGQIQRDWGPPVGVSLPQD